MLSQENTQEEELRKFHHETLQWKSMIGYIEKEIVFIKRLLNAKVFKKTTPSIFEKLQHFMHEVKTKIREVKNLKKEINEYEDKLVGILECQDIACDTYYLENHKDLKERFEEFYTDFNEYKTKVFNYTGSLL
jgi:hypothetical protein